MATNLDAKTGLAKNMGMVNNVDASFASFGFSYEPGLDFTISGEYGQRRVDSSMFADTDGYYVTVDKKIGKWRPYVTYASIDSNKSKKVNGMQAPVLSQNTTSVGVGYSITNTQIVSGEISSTSVGSSNTSNEFVSYQSNGNPLSGKSFNVYRLNYSFLF